MIQILTLLVAVSGDVPLTQFCDPKGCPAAEGGDWTEVLERAITSTTCAPPRAKPPYPDKNLRKSCTLRPGVGTFRITRRSELPRPIRIIGAGGLYGSGGATTFRFTPGVSGFWVPGTNPQTGYNGTLPGHHIGGGALFENLVIESEGPGTSLEPLTINGLDHAGPVTLNHVNFSNWPGSCIKPATPKGGNIIGSTYAHVGCSQPGGRGIDIPFGSNSNEMSFFHLTISRPCARWPGTYDPAGDPAAWCSGFRYAGGTGVKLDTTLIDMMGHNWPPYVFAEGGTSNSTLVHAYVEGAPTALSRVKYGTVFGGNIQLDPRDKTMKVGSKGLEGTVEFSNSGDPENQTRTTMGPSLPKSFEQFQVMKPGGDQWNWVADPLQGAIRFSWGRWSQPAFSVTGGQSPYGPNHFRVPDLIIGEHPTASPKQSSGTRANRPTTMTTWPPGSFWWNQSTVVGGPVGWVVCLVEGVRRWCPVGQIGVPE